MKTIDTKFEWHVQTEKFVRLASMTTTKIVNRVFEGLNQFVDFRNSRFIGVAFLCCNSQFESEPNEAEKNCLYNGFAVGIERIIYKDIVNRFGID